MLEAGCVFGPTQHSCTAENSSWTDVLLHLHLDSTPTIFIPLYIFFSCPSQEAEALIGIRLSVCVIQRLAGCGGAQVQSGPVHLNENGLFPPGNELRSFQHLRTSRQDIPRLSWWRQQQRLCVCCYMGAKKTLKPFAEINLL